MTLLKTIVLGGATLALLAVSSFARDGHWRGHGGGWHGGPRYGGPRFSFGIGLAAPVYPVYSYYRPYYYAPAPVVVAPRAVVVGREVGGDVAVDAQRVLARKGYYCGVVDGVLGPQSRAAIRAWQADTGQAVTGTLNTATLRSLGLI